MNKRKNKAGTSKPKITHRQAEMSIIKAGKDAAQQALGDGMDANMRRGLLATIWPEEHMVPQILSGGVLLVLMEIESPYVRHKEEPPKRVDVAEALFCFARPREAQTAAGIRGMIPGKDWRTNFRAAALDFFDTLSGPQIAALTDIFTEARERFADANPSHSNSDEPEDAAAKK